MKKQKSISNVPEGSALEKAGPLSPRGFSLRTLVLFLGLFIAATLVWSTARDTVLERLVIDRTTVATSARLIAWLTPAEQVRAEGHRLLSPNIRLSVLNGCEGTESILLLAAAVLAFPAPWHRKPIGLLIGAAGIFLLNQARIVSLFYILRHRPQWFAATHGYIAPTFIILFGSLLFLLWLRWVEGGHDKVQANE